MAWGLHVLVLCACLSVLGALFAPAHWFLDVLSQFLLPSLSLLAAAPLAMIALMLVSRIDPRHAAAVPVSLAFLIAGSAIVQDPPVSVPEGGTTLSVYQHNIYVENIVIERIVETVEREDPDIIALVETRDDMIAPWVERLRERWPHMGAARSEKHAYARLRLFSKYEILDYRVRKRDYEPATLRARLATPGGEMTVIIAHFTRPWPFKEPAAQTRHYEALKSMLAEETGPLLLLGDFNSAPWGRFGRPLQHDLGFQLANRRSVGTWPGRINVDDMMDTPGVPRWFAIPIDLAFCRGGAVCTGHRVGGNLGSDHRYTQFDVHLPPASEARGTDAP